MAFLFIATLRFYTGLGVYGALGVDAEFPYRAPVRPIVDRVQAKFCAQVRFAVVLSTIDGVEKVWLRCSPGRKTSGETQAQQYLDWH